MLSLSLHFKVCMGILSLLPIVMAVSLALYTKNAVFSLFCGLLCASILINIDQPLMGIFYVFDPLLTQALANGDSIKVIFFSLLIAIGVEVMRQSGGTKALVAFFLRFTKTRRTSMVTMWFAGLTVFFDDYANCLIVGSSMRSVADKARISRAKLAYLVDSTAAPVATLALISTWIGYEVSLMDKAMNTVEQIPYAVQHDQNHVYLCDVQNEWKAPYIDINGEVYPAIKTEQGWLVYPKAIPAKWSISIQDTEHKTSSFQGINPYKSAAIAVQKKEKDLVLCTEKYKNQYATKIYPKPSQDQNLTVIFPDDASITVQSQADIISEEVQNGRRHISFASASLIHVTQDDQTGTINPEGMGFAEVEWFEHGLRAQKQNAYAFFLEGLPYRFYPILALVFGLGIALSGRDFGPMYDAETKQLSSEVESDEEISFSWGNFSIAVIPLFVLIVYTGLDLYWQGVDTLGSNAPLFAIIGEADGYQSMLRGSIAFSIITIVLALGQKTSRETIQRSIKTGGSHLIEPLCILALAWALGNGISELKTAQFLVDILDQSFPVQLLPSIVFVLAAGISFATGTSFGTMGTLMPIALPLAIQLQTSPEICLATAAAVLSGATWGDHCSPISDTTILASAGTGCDHVEHVRTQLPYAISSGVISLLFCSLPVGWGIHWSVCLIAGSIGCVACIAWRGKIPQATRMSFSSLQTEGETSSHPDEHEPSQTK